MALNGVPVRQLVSEAEKTPALRALLAEGAEGITLEDPTLDDIYAHFLRSEAA